MRHRLVELAQVGQQDGPVAHRDGHARLKRQDLVDVDQRLVLLAHFLIDRGPEQQDGQVRRIEDDRPIQFVQGGLVIGLKGVDSGLGQRQVEIVGHDAFGLLQDGQCVGVLLLLDQDHGLELIAGGVLGLQFDGPIEVGQRGGELVGVGLGRTPGTQHGGVVGRNADGLVEVGHPLLGILPGAGAKHEGLGTQLRFIVGLLDGQVQGLDRPLRVSARR